MLERYPSKILIAGEYTILNGSGAMAIPFAKCSMQWEKGNHPPDDELSSFCQFMKGDRALGERLALENFQAAIQECWKLSSNIPRGYGLGSSGAVCAAVWDRFQIETYRHLDPKEVHQVLKKMESYFHGQSSGMDPMVSYYNKPVLYDGTTMRYTEGLDEEFFNAFQMYLLDSGIPRQTQNGIQWYRRQCEENSFQEKIFSLAQVNKQLIEAMLHQDLDRVSRSWVQLSQMSLEFFSALIPSKLIPLWHEGIEHQTFYIKLCGAGGGGYFLVHCKDHEAFKMTCKRYGLSYSAVPGQ